jgi:hypothetical protein
MEGYCSTGQSPQRAVVPMEEEEVNINETEFKFYRLAADSQHNNIKRGKN